MNISLGIDFDNTIVCYNDVFHEVMVERELITGEFPKNKEKIRNYLRETGREAIWTELQGYVYGKRMITASPFPGVLSFIKNAITRGIKVSIISHKTRHPYLGEKYDLHAAAYGWLEKHNFFSMQGIGMDHGQVSFLETKHKKIATIATTQCSHFIDDLPEILLDEAFPKAVQKLLFSPEDQAHLANTADASATLLKFNHWDSISRHLLGDVVS